MIILNGKKFARNEKEFTDSLFEKEGTCCGYYRPYKNQVSLFDHNKNKIGAVTRSKVLALATRQDNGKYWYSYGDIPLIGEFSSYSEQCKQVDAIVYKYLLVKS